MKGNKPGVSLSKLHPDIVAGSKIPLTLICYSPFMSEALPYELEEYIDSVDGQLIYVDSSEDLAKTLDDLQKLI